MLKKNVEGIEKMMADYLTYRFKLHLRSEEESRKPNPDWLSYIGATRLIEAIGGEWRRNYRGDDTEEALNNPANYSHWVMLPSDERCKRLNFDAWEE